MVYIVDGVVGKTSRRAIRIASRSDYHQPPFAKPGKRTLPRGCGVEAVNGVPLRLMGALFAEIAQSVEHRSENSNDLVGRDPTGSSLFLWHRGFSMGSSALVGPRPVETAAKCGQRSGRGGQGGTATSVATGSPAVIRHLKIGNARPGVPPGAISGAPTESAERLATLALPSHWGSPLSARASAGRLARAWRGSRLRRSYKG